MVNELTGNRRQEWAFTYKAKDLLPYAHKKLYEFQTEETAARRKMSEMIQDPATFHNDAGLQNLKRDIDRAAGLREQFQVYCHEFERTPNLEFKLGLADVVFFGLLEASAPGHRATP